MTDSELIGKILRALEYQCLDTCFDFDNESVMYEFENRQYRLYNDDVEYIEKLLERLSDYD